MIDWRAARYIAGRVGGDPVDSGPNGLLVREMCWESEDLVRTYTQLTEGPKVPDGEVVSRAEWIEANSLSMGPLLDAAMDGIGAKAAVKQSRNGAGVITAAAVTFEAGAVLGLMSRRVLGQYDLALIPRLADPPPRLLFVGPNIATATKSFGGAGPDFLRWVAIHEMTHAVQFSSIPWLRSYIGGLAYELLLSFEEKVPGARRSVTATSRSVAGRAARTVAGRDPLALVLNEQQHRLVERMQAVMSVVEGHAEHVMDAAGAQVIPNLERLRSSMSARRQQQKPLWKLLGRLMGMEMKMRQYEQGRQFCDAVVREAGVAGLNRVWSEPDALPSLAEVGEPSKWLARQTHSV